MASLKKVSKDSDSSLPMKKMIHQVKKSTAFKAFEPEHKLQVEMLPQPNDVTCGPTCLHAIYRYYGDDTNLDDVIKEIYSFEEGGGTWAVWLACHALNRGYDATIYTYNLETFDPSWFGKKAVNLPLKLKEQMEAKKNPRLTLATQAYLEFLEKGGQIRYEDLSRNLIKYFLLKNIPILAGLSITFLYRISREISKTNEYDDVIGEPGGHFVVLSGYDRAKKTVLVSDPYARNPYQAHVYKVPIDRVINAILLGASTHDANFLIIYPK